jgi:transposase-like protein
MTRSADSVKRQIWRERLQRFERGRSTIAAFCQAEGVSAAAFYQWRRILGRPAGSSATRAPGLAVRQPTTLGRQTFLPVDVVGAATIDIHLPNGVRLALPAGDRAALENAILAVARLPGNGEEVEPC